jgi:hypothetical protein
MNQTFHSGIYLKECKSSYYKDTCTPICIAAVFNSAMENSQEAPLLMNGLRKCGIYTQWNFSQPWRRMKSYHLQVNGWNWRTSSWVRLARLRRPKIVCSSWYADFRGNKKKETCIVIKYFFLFTLSCSSNGSCYCKWSLN